MVITEPEAKPKPMEKVPVADKSQLGAKLAAGAFVAFVEILPPRGLDASKEVAGAKLCKEAGIDCINVPDGPRASARLSAQVTCQLIQKEAGIEAITFDAATSKAYVEKSKEIGWENALKQSPQYGAALKKVLAK